MIMPSKDNLYNGRKGIGFENPSHFEKAKDLRPTLYDEKVIGLGYTLMFLTHSNEALEIEKFKRSRENKIELNASYVNEKINFEDDYFQEIINPDFEKIDSLFQQTSSLKPYVSNAILKKIIIDLEDEVVNLLEKEKVNLETIESLKSKSFESSENIVQICLWIIDSGCSKHMTGNRALLTNFVEKFLGTVRFGNNDFAVITGYGDVIIDEASEVIISFIKKTQVNLQLQVQCVRTDNGTEFKNKTLAKFFDEVGSTQQFSAARTPQQNGVVERRNRTLVEAARTMLTFDADVIFSIIMRMLESSRLKAKGDIRVFIGYSKESAAFRIYNKRTLLKVDEASKNDLEDLFQDFYDEYFDSSKIMKSSTTNVETPINEEVFHEVSKSFQGESSLSSLNDDVKQSPE
nr:hypothetical protein [Tanacetum cinerariifolium]